MPKIKFTIKYFLIFILGLSIGLISAYSWPRFIEATPKYKNSQLQSAATEKKNQKYIDEQNKMIEVVKSTLQDATSKLAYERPAELKKRMIAECGPEKVFSKSASTNFDGQVDYYKTNEGKEYAQCTKGVIYNLASDVMNDIVE